MAVSRRNSALTYYVNGRRAKDLHGLTDLAGNALSRYDTAMQRALAGLKRRAGPAANRVVREQFGVRLSALSGKFRVEDGTRADRGRNGAKSDFISIWASTRRIPLLDFGGRWSKGMKVGATASVLAGQRKQYAGAFRATIQGKDAIRVRQFDKSTGKRHGRGPVRMLYGPSPFAMLSPGDHSERASLAAREHMLDELHGFYTSELLRQLQLASKRKL